MPDYKEMYILLFQSMTRAITKLSRKAPSFSYGDIRLPLLLN